MRFVTIASDSGPRAAVVRPDGCYVDLHHADAALPRDMTQLLALGRDGLLRVATAMVQGKVIDSTSVKLLPPVPRPEKIFCIGLNYADHARETGKQPPPEPIVFSKFVTALRGPDQPIELPRLSDQVDFEAELVVVIGTGGRHIPKHQALSHVAGYTCGNDVSARDWQNHKPGRQWLLGKSFDSFAPLGPQLVTADELGDAGDLRIRLRIDGQTMQDSRTSQLIFAVPDLISYISGVCTLSPGDLIFTGTPPGVGFARQPPFFLRPGNVVEVEIDRLGTLRNPVTAEK